MGLALSEFDLVYGLIIVVPISIAVGIGIAFWMFR